MSRLDGYSARQGQTVTERLGWVFVRSSDRHFVYEKPGVAEHLSIPNHRTVGRGLLSLLVKVMGITLDEFVRMVKK